MDYLHVHGITTCIMLYEIIFLRYALGTFHYYRKGRISNSGMVTLSYLTHYPASKQFGPLSAHQQNAI